jgi:hypothetical protein
LARKQVDQQIVHGSEGSTKTGPGGGKQSGREVRKECCLSPSLFNVHSKYLIKEALECFGDLKITEKVICTMKYVDGGPGSVVGIATAYGLDGPGIDSRWGGGEIFRTCSGRHWGPPSLLHGGYRVFPRGNLWPWRDADPSPPSSVEVKNRLELYLYSP